MSNYAGGVQNRRKRALKRLEEQLQTGIKVVKDDNPEIPGRTAHPLEDKDIKRIKKEIEVIKARI